MLKIQVQAVRGVGCTRGYPYYAWGVYQATMRADRSGYYWKLVRSGQRFRSDVRGRLAFDGIARLSGTTHGRDATAYVAEQLGFQHDAPVYMIADRMAEVCVATAS